MNPSPEVQALAVHALKDFHTRNHLSMQFLLHVEMTPFKELARMGVLLFGSPHTTKAGLLSALRRHLQKEPFRFLKLCQLGMTSQVRDYVNLDQDTLNQGAMKSAAAGMLQTLQYLLGCGADPQQCLNEAATNGRLAVVEYLVGLGLTEHHMALYKAAKGGHLAVVSYLVAQGTTAPTETHFWAAATQGHIQVVELLLPMLGKLENLGKLDEVIQPELLRLLVSRLTEAELRQVDLSLCLRNAAMSGNWGLYRFIRERALMCGRDLYLGNLSFWAGRGGNLAILKDVLQLDPSGYELAFRAAAGKGHLELVQYLLGTGKIVFFQQPLMEAFQARHLEVARLIGRQMSPDQLETVRAQALAVGLTSLLPLLDELQSQ